MNPLGPLRTLVDNPVLGRFTVSMFIGTNAEWTMFVVALVYAFDRGGPNAAGAASVVMLIANAACAPLAGVAAERYRPNRVRLGAYAGQVVGFGGAAAGAYAVAPAWVVIAWCSLGVAATTFVRPASAVLVPAIVRSSRELTSANLFVGFCESACVLGGPLLATVLLAAGGPALGLAGCAAASAASAAIGAVDLATDPPPATTGAGDRPGPVRGLIHSVAVFRGRPGAGGVLVVAASQYVLVGALDLLFVVFAADVLDLGDAGPGLLGTAFGIGAMVSVLAAAPLVGRGRLAPIVVGSLATIGITAVALGLVRTLVLALLVLPVLGLARSLVDLTTRMLLQRSSPPHELAGAFALLEFLAATGMLLGAVIAQVFVAASGSEAALIAMGCFFAVVLGATWPSLRRADDAADVPIVAVSLLRQHPVFAPLPPVALEAVGRSAEERIVAAGDVVVTEGDEGDRFYAVADGTFDVVMDGTFVRTVRRGGGFGEVALLADVPRTATVTATADGALLAIERVPFLVAVTGSDSSHLAAWGVIRAMHFAADVPDVGPRDTTRPG